MEDTLTQKPLKTYSKIDDIPRKITQKICYKTRIAVFVKREPLTTKRAIELLLNGTLKRQVCRYCMNVTNVLNDLDQIMHISGKDALYKVSIRDMVATFHPFKVVDDPNFPNKICEKCLNETIRSYRFAQQCERSERAIRNCFDDMYDKLEKLDPLERKKKRGRQKQNPNQNMLRTEHKYVMDYADPIHYLINSGTVPFTNETMMTELECKRCWQVLPNIESLVNHEMIHPKTMWYNCRLCGKTYPKKFHLKKHLRSHNKNSELVPEYDKAFECKECGFISQDYHVHLQHIEKHKFGRVMQNLLNRKMDTLCSVCLDNRSQMLDLDKTICLHGGYPELTGERSVFNILGASVPELKQKYKYQDLYVPSQANIMTIIKKNKKEKLYSTENYIISSPTILSTEKKEYGKTYLFIFDNPSINLEGVITDDDFNDADNELSTNNDGQNAETSDTNNQSCKNTLSSKLTYSNYDFEENSHEMLNISISVDTANENEKEIYSAAKENIKFTFSKPDYVINVVNKFNNSLIETKINNATQCKTCWIFKKPTCEDCVTRSSDENELKLYTRPEICQTNTSDKTCQSCWIFKNKNCDICKSWRNTQTSFSTICTIVGTESEVPEGNVILKTRQDYETNHIITSKANLNNIVTEKDNNSRKRKILEDDRNLCAKKAKWQCNICLTVNTTNRETCICCDHYVLDSETVSKFNWEHNEIFASNFGQKGVSSSSDNINFNMAPERSDLEKTNIELKVDFAKQVNNKQEELSLSIDNEMDDRLETKIFEKLLIEEDMDVTENITTTIDANVIQSIDQELGKNMNNNNINQAHDLNFSVFHIDNANMDSEDVPKELPLSLQFNIGKGPQEKKNLRRFKKPLRRTSQK